jgi:hypothetical protein
VFAARYELNSYIVFRKRLVSKRLIKHHYIKAYERGKVNLEAFLTLVLNGDEQSRTLYSWRKGPFK